jgi:hypothetical protein
VAYLLEPQLTLLWQVCRPVLAQHLEVPYEQLQTLLLVRWLLWWLQEFLEELCLPQPLLLCERLILGWQEQEQEQALASQLEGCHQQRQWQQFEGHVRWQLLHSQLALHSPGRNLASQEHLVLKSQVLVQVACGLQLVL